MVKASFEGFIPAGASRSHLHPVASVSRREGVMSEIRRAIVMGALKPGQRLTETSLASTLQVSRPTIREALNQLAQEGLVAAEPYRGLRIAAIEPTAVLDIARTRMALDTLAVQDILADKSGRRLAEVRAAWETYDALESGADPVTAHEAHVAFHRRLWAASENTLLTRLWPVTEAHLTIVLAYDQSARSDARRAHAVHRDLAEAILTRDPERVQAALEAHTMDSARELVEILTADTRVDVG